MLKNLKHSILFILIIITLFLVVVMSLAASKPLPSINTATVNARKENNLPYGKWTGLGMGLFTSSDTELFDSWVDTLLANGFTELRIEIANYQDTVYMARSKVAVISAVAKGIKVIWGVTSNKFDNPDYTITVANWPTFRAAILDAAQWAQDNGVYEFQIGNEEEYHIDNITITDTQIMNNLRAVATDAQAIFTNGKISYTVGHYYVAEWIAAGKGGLDILAYNCYRQSGNGPIAWETDILNLVNTFGTDGTYITEFGPSGVSLDDYSTDEAVQAQAIFEMIDYIKASGITRALYFCWNPLAWGVLKTGGTYKQLWNTLISSTSTPNIAITSISKDFGSMQVSL